MDADRNVPKKHVFELLGDASLEEWIKIAIRDGVDINTPSDCDYTMLECAVMSEHVNACTFLIQQGADASRVRCNGETPLMLAAMKSQKVVKTLLTTIPPEVSQTIRFHIFGIYWLQNAQPKLLTSIRWIIIQKLVDSLVADQMPRIEKLIGYRDHNHWGPITIVQRYAKMMPEKVSRKIISFLEIEKPECRKKIMKLLDANIKRILFGKPSMIKFNRNKYLNTIDNPV